MVVYVDLSLSIWPTIIDHTPKNITPRDPLVSFFEIPDLWPTFGDFHGDVVVLSPHFLLRSEDPIVDVKDLFVAHLLDLRSDVQMSSRNGGIFVDDLRVFLPTLDRDLV